MSDLRNALVHYYDRLSPSQKRSFRDRIRQITHTTQPVTIQEIPDLLRGTTTTRRPRLYQKQLKELGELYLSSSMGKLLQSNEKGMGERLASYLGNQIGKLGMLNIHTHRNLYQQILPTYRSWVIETPEMIPLLEFMPSLVSLTISLPKKLSHASLVELVHQFSSLTKLEELIMMHQPLGRNEWERIGPCLSQWKRLRVLDLLNTRMGTSGMEVLAPYLSQCIQLRSLDLGWNGLHDQGCVQFAQQSLPFLVRLQNLYLHHNEMGIEGSMALAHSLSGLTQLEDLDIRENPIGDLGYQAFSFLRSFPLEYLNLYDTHLGMNGCSSIVSFLDSVQTLHHFNIGANPIGSDGIQAMVTLFPHWKTLEILNIQKIQLTSIGARLLAPHLKYLSRLKELIMSDNPIQDEGCQILCRWLPELKRLERVDLTKCEIGTEGIKALFHTWTRWTHLKSFHIGHNNRIGTEGWTVFASSCLNIHAIRELNLSKNGIDNKSMERIRSGLRHLSTLQSLHIDRNQIGNEGIHELCLSLPFLSQLKDLNVSYNNRMGYAAVQELVQTLLSLKEMKRLTLTSVFRQALRENRKTSFVIEWV